jgi:hypothetical protein
MNEQTNLHSYKSRRVQSKYNLEISDIKLQKSFLSNQDISFGFINQYDEAMEKQK